MATSSNNNISFAPPTPEELQRFAPPSPEEVQLDANQSNQFAPPTAEELQQFAPPAPEERELPSGVILKDEWESISRKYNLSPEQREWVEDELPTMGATVEGRAPTGPFTGVKQAIGFIGRAAGVQELASKISRERQPDNVSGALEEFQAIIRERKSGLETGAELAAGLVIPAGVAAKSIAGSGVAGAVIGALQGYGSAKEGEEVEGTAIGATLGGTLGTVGGYAINKLFGPKSARIVSESIKDSTAKFEQQMQEAAVELEPVKQRILSVLDAEDPNAAMIALTQDKKVVDSLIPDEATKAQILKEMKRELKKAKVQGPLEIGPEGIAKRMIKREVEDVLDYLEANGNIQKVQPKKRTTEEFFQAIAEQRRLGPERLKQAADELMASRAAQDAVHKNVDILTRKQPGMFASVVKSILDGRVRLGLIDDRLSTSLEVGADASARSMNTYSNILHGIGKLADDLDKELRRIGLTDQASRAALFDQINNPKAVIDEVYRPAVEKYKKNTDALASLLNKQLGREVLKPGEAQRYILNTVVDVPEFVRRVTSKFDAINKKVGFDILANPDATAVAWKQLQQIPEFKDVQRALTLFGRPADNALSLVTSGRLAQNPSSLRENFETIASSLLERKDAIPDFLLEKDPAKLLVLWAERNLRPTFISPFLSQLRTARNIALKANDKDAIQYTTGLIQDLTGVRKGTIAASVNDALLNAKAKALVAMDRADGLLAKTFWRFVAEAPDLLPGISNQVYPNFLGWSAKAIVSNLAQPITMTVPELGPLYGPRVVFQAMAEAAPDIPRLFGNKLREEMIEKGLVGRQYSTEIAAIKKGLEKNNIYRLGEKVLQKQAEVAMYLFERSEAANRLITSKAGRIVAKQFLQGDAGAINFISKLPNSYQKAIKAASKDPEAVGTLLENYLIGKTLFNYNRQTLSEFGRFMGPLFSVFTKWPAAISGDVYRTLLNKGAIKGGGDLGVRYMGPLASLMMVQQLLPDSVTEEERFKGIFGNEGLASSSPILTVKSIAEGEFFAPPSVSATKDLATGILTGDKSKVWRWFNDSLAAFTPGAWVGRVVGRDIPRLIKNQPAPEGTYLQKVFPNSNIDELFRSSDD